LGRNPGLDDLAMTIMEFFALCVAPGLAFGLLALLLLLLELD
jgi:hypothetical protein